jgi:hypothetical protein
MTKEGDAKIEQDLRDTRRILAQTNSLLRRIDAAAEKYLGEGNGNGGRAKPA